MKSRTGLRARRIVFGALCTSPFRLNALLACFLWAVLVCAGCASAPRSAPLPPDTTLLTGVPFFPQEDYQCGPSAIAMVINYWYGKEGRGRHLAFRQAVAETYSPTARGVLGLDLRLFAKRLGFQAEEQTGSIDRLKGLIDRGIPAIILVDYGVSLYQRNHFMVVTGYNKDSVIVNSGRAENEQIAKGELEKIWKKTIFWTLVIKPSA